MNHFLLPLTQFSDDFHTVTITGDEAHHMAHVLRMKAGEEFSASVLDSDDTAEYRFGVTEIADGRVTGELRFIKKEGAELSTRITLFQGLPKADKLELILQKAVELGVFKVVPVQCERSVVKLDAKKAAAKEKRWRSIAHAAAEQSRRGIVPEVQAVCSFEDAIKQAATLDLLLFPYELAGEECDAQNAMQRTRQAIRSAKDVTSIGVFIGPEGGFSKKEVAAAKEAGAVILSLGRRILRTETAAIAVLSALMLELED